MDEIAPKPNDCALRLACCVVPYVKYLFGKNSHNQYLSFLIDVVTELRALGYSVLESAPLHRVSLP